MKQHLLKFIFPIACIIFSCPEGQAQRFSIDGEDVNTCSGIFLDSGGEESAYSPNESFIVTICPEQSGGNNIQLTFSGTDIADDQLCFYDGPDTTANLISCADEFNAGASFVIQASADNTSGCITLFFRSNNEEEGTGWEANIRCIPNCQLIQAVLQESSPPVADTGWIDLCQGQTLELIGRGIYPENGNLYTQSDSSSNFTWNFGDGHSAFGPQVRHTYDQPGGYIVQLTIEDTLGCTNTNFISQRVRVSPDPNFSINQPLADNYCLGDTIAIKAQLNQTDAGNLSVVPQTAFFQSSAFRADSLPLPDGDGAIYQASVQFDNFTPGQQLDDINDLTGICLNIEHSWMRDLEIQLSCPNGQSVLLHQYAGRSDATLIQLGEPIRGDEANISPGTGYEYCWTPNATNPNWVEYGKVNQPTTLPPDDYQSLEPLDQLQGCPLNGEWTLKVADRWPVDNGFIFSWGIDFDPSLYPKLEQFTPEFEDFGWTINDSSVSVSPTEILAVLGKAGTNNYPFFVVDELGCRYDTSLSVNVLAPTQLSCLASLSTGLLNDTTLCRGDSIQLDATQNIPDTSQVSFEVFPDYELGFSNHPHESPYESVIEVVDIFPGTLDKPLQQIKSVCIDMTTDWAEDIHFFLESPSGQLLELSTDNGGGDDDYLNTCFRPDAVTSIREGVAPFTGNFQPEGNWNDLQGATINGAWTLLVSDGFGDTELGNLESWSITFNTTNQISYSWAPSQNISCTDCPTPTIVANNTQTYYLTITDVNDYRLEDSIRIEVPEDIELPEVTCTPSTEGDVRFTWPLRNDTRYDIRYRINNEPEVLLENYTNGFLVIDNLLDNDSIFFNLIITPSFDGLTCSSLVVSDTCRFIPCDLALELVNQTGTSCSNTNDALVSFTASGGTLPYEFLGNNQLLSGDTVTFSNVRRGSRLFLVRDARGCVDSLRTAIASPEPVEVALDLLQSISCADSADAIIEAVAFGGTGAYRFLWEDNLSTTSLLENVGAGTYNLTVTDENNCTVTDSITLTSGPLLTLSLDTRPPSCTNTFDGSVLAIVSGGEPPYTFDWNIGSTESAIDLVGRGNYEVTVTDARACSLTASVNLTTASPLRIDSVITEPTRCFGTRTGRATVFASGGTGNLEYLWDDPLGQIDSVANNLNSGTYNVEISDQNGCSITTQVFVEQADSVSVSVEVLAVSCRDGSDGQAMATGMGGTGSFTYIWDNGVEGAQIRNLTAGRYEVRAIDENGCEAESSVEVTQPDSVFTINAFQVESGCFGKMGNSAAVSTSGGNGAPFTYNWPDGQSTPSAVNLDSTIVMVTVTDSKGCPATDTVKLRDLPEIEANIIISPPSCHGFDNGALGINFVTGGTGNDIEEYTFEWNTGQTSSAIEGLLGGQEYVVTVTDPIGCTAVERRTMDEPAEIAFDPFITDVSCFGGNDGSIVLENIRGDGNNFQISWGGGANGIDNMASNLGAGTYAVTITDGRNCSNVETLEVQQPTPIRLSFETQDNNCFNEQEGEATVIAEGGVGNYSYRWSNGDTTAVAIGLSAGEYSVVIVDSNGCDATGSAVIFHPDPFDVTFDVKPPSCFGDRNGAVTVNVSGGTPPYSFSMDNKDYKTSNAFLGLQADRYKIFIRDQRGCLLFEDVLVNEPEPFSVRAVPKNRSIDIGDSLQLRSIIEGGEGRDISLFWKAPYGGTLNCDTCGIVIAKPDFTITYELIATTAEGCTSNDFISIQVNKPKVLLVPTGFTPNGDGNNDFLIVHGDNNTLIRRFQVFNRQGALVYEALDFQANDQSNGWNGNFKNQAAQSGVYIWVVEAAFQDGSTEVYRGQTTLVR